MVIILVIFTFIALLMDKVDLAVMFSILALISASVMVFLDSYSQKKKNRR